VTSAATPNVWAGVDIGGTGTRVVLMDDDGEYFGGCTVATVTFNSEPVARLAAAIGRLVPSDARLRGVGIGASGPVDLTTGIIDNPDTLPQFTRLDVAGGIAARLGVDTWIDGDAVVAGLAEYWWGTAKPSPSLLCVTLGTGIGAVLIHQGAPLRTADGQHPEGGHIPVSGEGFPCYCGLPQCWEQVASRSALDGLRRTWQESEQALWAEYARRLASGLVALLTLYRPHAVVIGGSVAQDWDRLEGPLRRELSNFREFDSSRPLLASALGERAGAQGAALLPFLQIGWRERPLDGLPELMTARTRSAGEVDGRD
jgi:glucokinase